MAENQNCFDALKLDNQLCFPLYACAKAVVRRYTPLLESLDLTYTQYIVLLILWEQGSINSKELGHRLYLDSGTLTPVLLKLEQKGYLKRERDPQDHRHLTVTLTQRGKELQQKALSIPAQMGSCMQLEAGEATQLKALLVKLMTHIQESTP